MSPNPNPIPTGKLPPESLARVLTGRLGRLRPDVLVHSGVGEDCAVIAFGDEVCIASSDPITGAAERAGWLSVHVACNDVAASGGEPVGVLVTLLLPVGSSEVDVAQVMAEIGEAAAELGIEVLGGHTEVAATVTAPLITVTALGRAPRDCYVTSAGARPGDDLILTGAAALEGTAILAADLRDRLAPLVGEAVLTRARELRSRLSVVRAGVTAARLGVTSMHDATEGGVIGAAAELAIAAGVAIELWPDAVPVLPETAAICAALRLDPLRLIASGALVITAPAGDGVAARLAAAGIDATVIGRVGARRTARLVDRQGDAIAPPTQDELWRALAEL